MKRPLTTSEKRTIRIAAIGVACYLVVFYGFAARDALVKRRADYDALMTQARELRDMIQPYQDRIAAATNLMDRFRMDPAKLNHATVMAEASAAIHRAAVGSGVGIGAMKETAGHAAARQAGSIQFEVTAPIPAVLALLHNLTRTGYPAVIDTMQMTSDPRMPNGVKVSLTIVILDFESWKPKEEQPNV